MVGELLADGSSTPGVSMARKRSLLLSSIIQENLWKWVMKPGVPAGSSRRAPATKSDRPTPPSLHRVERGAWLANSTMACLRFKDRSEIFRDFRCRGTQR